MLAISHAPGIEDIVRDQASLDTDEERKEIEVGDNLLFDGFESLLKEYEAYLDGKIDYDNVLKDYNRGRFPALSPEQANVFLQATRRYEFHKNYAMRTGYFTTAILQSSYNAGHYKFKFTTKNLVHIDNFAYRLIATEKKPIEIIIDGSIGSHCGFYGQNIIMYAESIGKWCGANGKNIIIHAKDIGNQCACNGENITVHAESIGDHCGHAGINIIIHAKNIGNQCADYGQNITVYAETIGRECGLRAKNSTFKTPNEKTFKQIKKSIERNSGNRIYFINADGTEEKCKV